MKWDGAALARAREQRGLSQRELASRAGVTQAYLSRLESGAQAPGLVNFVQLADALGAQQLELLVLLERCCHA